MLRRDDPRGEVGRQVHRAPSTSLPDLSDSSQNLRVALAKPLRRLCYSVTKLPINVSKNL